eukprot:3510584-Ditylum_brightwellii.AAC.1
MALLGFVGRIPDDGVTGIANGLAVGLFVVLDSFMVESGGFLEISVPDGRVSFKKQSVKSENDCDTQWKLAH